MRQALVSLLSAFHPETMIFMVALSSLLQSCVLLGLGVSVKQYKGVPIYVLGTVFCALSFLGFLVRGMTPTPSLIRFINNTLLVSGSLLYTIGIGQFLGKKIKYNFWLFLLTIVIIFQAYYIYYFDNYFLRNITVILPIILGYALSLAYFIRFDETGFAATSRCFSLVLIVGILVFTTRLVLLLDGQTQSISDVTIANTFTFLSLFIVDFLRNGFFVLLVSQRMYFELKKISEIDFLTDVYNRGAAAKKIETILQKNTGLELTLILLDVDYFKKVNDAYGHDVGDLALKDISRILKLQLQKKDIVSRWGGEEFLLFLPGCSTSEARDRAESLRREVCQHSLICNAITGERISCTISLGVVTTRQGNYSLDELLKEADIALYDAKTNGRNQAKYVMLCQETL
ncbi:MAG: GGDEF domain protein [Phormidium sp. OSCR]|nr:MAG: GGDEF domain protein [Phormidium sp. OSCR]